MPDLSPPITPQEAERVWKSQVRPSACTVAIALTHAGRPVHFTIKAPALLLYLRVRWRPLSGISLLTEFGGVPLTAVMTFPECTDVVPG
jgi:hypothetical protein